MKKRPYPNIDDFVVAAKKGTHEAYEAKKAREASDAKTKASQRKSSIRKKRQESQNKDVER